MRQGRYKVTIHCNLCGERYVLRGRKSKGKVNTGFKSCLCNNASAFDVDVVQL